MKVIIIGYYCGETLAVEDSAGREVQVFPRQGEWIEREGQCYEVMRILHNPSASCISVYVRPRNKRFMLS